MSTELEIIHIGQAMTPGERRSLTRRASSGMLRRIGHGAYVLSAQWDAARPEQRLIARVRAAAARRDGRVFVGLSAAVLWGLPLVTQVEPAPEIGTSDPAGGRSSPHVRSRLVSGRLDVVEVGGVRCTPLAQTLADVAAWYPPETSVPVIDAGLRSVERDRVLAVASSRPVIAHARQRTAIMFADGMSGSPGESLSRVAIARLGFARPALQREFRDREGLIGFVDFSWDDDRVVGEFDGHGKYSDERFAHGRTPAEIVIDEKTREDRLRRQVDAVARWTWPDVWSRPRLDRILRATGMRPSGTFAL